MRVFTFSAIATTLIMLLGCTSMLDNSRFYDGSIPHPAQRWPLNLLACQASPWVFTGLELKISTLYVPSWTSGINYTCAPPMKSPIPDIYDDANVSRDTFTHVDKAMGAWNAYDVIYGQIVNTNNHLYKPDANNISPGQFYDPRWIYQRPHSIYYPDEWSFNREITTNVEVINGIQWQYAMFWQYSSLSSRPDDLALPVNSQYGDPSDGSASTPLAVVVRQPGALALLGEVYMHRVDSTHTMLVYAVYKRPVVQDAQWLAARRGLLRKLVNAVKITPLTGAQIEEYKQQAAAYHDAALARDCAAGTYTGKLKKLMCK